MKESRTSEGEPTKLKSETFSIFSGVPGRKMRAGSLSDAAATAIDDRDDTRRTPMVSSKGRPRELDASSKRRLRELAASSKGSSCEPSRGVWKRVWVDVEW